ncbi:YcaO-like family protein [Arthrobacter sp. H35-D1]|uniref:YcaO-like family protein n=1 Tax=Arthrobacter sp. H35-D1 TaxID=3046202 RepID=UPI0024B87E88|nr:YcaO-like family protein [Arthrobacter sp. H35-D1]MDJ0312187.1 YcaO-like family protein [Arthrobacter sp. H35-D1]
MKHTVYNHSVTWAPPSQDSDRSAALQEMLDVYSPFGQIRNVLTTFRSGLGTGGYQGSAAPFSLDHTFRRMLGLGALNAGLDRDIYGGGKGLALFDSVASSLGEAIERMLGSFSSMEMLGPENRTVATARQMEQRGFTIVHPKDYSIFTDEQLDEVGFRCQRWTPDTTLTWHRGTNLLTGGSHWVPAQLVHLFYISEPGEARIGASSSGGLATHVTDEEALSHGLLEVIERDAVNLSWFCKVPLSRIVVDRPFADPAINQWLTDAERAGVGMDFYLHRLDIEDVYVVTAINFEEDLDENAYMAGGGVGLSIEAAIRSALSEVVQAERMVRTPMLAEDWELAMGFSRMFGINRDAKPADFKNFIQVVPYYGYQENQPKLDWYFRSPMQPTVLLSELPSSNPSDEYSAVLELFRHNGFTPIAFDLTPESFRKVRLRKVFVPELVPAFPPNLPMLGHPRYRTLRTKLGLQEHDWTLADMPTDPLPYP